MSLASCAASLGLSVTLLESSLNTLDQGISDFPRLTQVLQNTRHFELLPESQVLEAQNDLRDEIGPQRDEILSRAQAALSKLERREYALKSKKELQEVRLQQKPSKPRLVSSPTLGARDHAANAEKLKALKAKQERLTYTLKRLNLEEERKNRMSLAPSSFVFTRDPQAE